MGKYILYTTEEQKLWTDGR